MALEACGGELSGGLSAGILRVQLRGGGALNCRAAIPPGRHTVLFGQVQKAP